MEHMLRKLIDERGFPMELLSRQSGVQEEEIRRLMKGADLFPAQSEQQREARGRLESLAAVLTLGMDHVSPDDRVQAIIEMLAQRGVGSEILAGYCKVKKGDIDSFSENPGTVSPEKKYRIASAVMFLYFLFKETIS